MSSQRQKRLPNLPSTIEHHLAKSPKSPLPQPFAGPYTMPPVTPITFPTDSEDSSTVGDGQHLMPQASRSPSNSAQKPPSFGKSDVITEEIAPPTPLDVEGLERLWSDIRLSKERKMLKEIPKVESFGPAAPEPTETGVVEISGITPKQPTFHAPQPDLARTKTKSEDAILTPGSPPPTRPTMSRRRSSHFTESSDGRMTTAVFDLPGCSKNDIHISFQRSRLVVSWQTVTISETQEGPRIVRERKEHKSERIIPLPDGTRFESIYAQMETGRLSITYPSIRGRNNTRRDHAGGTGHSRDRKARERQPSYRPDLIGKFRAEPSVTENW